MEFLRSTNSRFGRSAEYFEHACQSCHFEGNKVEAEGFCQNCQEYLCGSCVRYHRKATQSRRHIVLDMLEMQKERKPQKTLNVCTETCQKHTSELVKFFCKQHDIVGCNDCIVLGHKNCEIDYIPEIIGDSHSENERAMLIERMHAFEKKVEDVDDVLKKNVDEALKAHRNTLSEIENTRQQINKHLDILEKHVVSKITEVRRENQETEGILKEAIRTLKFELNSVKLQLRARAKQTCDMFVTVKQATASLIKMEKEFDSACCKAHMLISEISRNETSFDLPMWHPFGQLVKLDMKLPVFPPVMHNQRALDMAAVFTKEITNVELSSDEEMCEIHGMVSLPNNTLAFADHFNKYVKVIDTTHDKVTAKVDLTSEPFDITRISNDQLAVTLPDEEKIQLISLKERLTRDRVIEVRGACKGIDYTNSKFIVAYPDDAKIEILSLQGKLLKLIKTDNHGAGLFKSPTYVAVGSDLENIYVSDKEAVIKVTCNGRVLARYANVRSSWPEGLVVCNDGNVFVVVKKRMDDYAIGSSIHHITSDCKRIKILIENDLVYSTALCFDETSDHLFINHECVCDRDWISRKIRMYRLIST